MGKKTYFEFLEEEFQVLASSLQSNLSVIAADDSYDYNPEKVSAVSSAKTQLARCQAVLRQLLAESRSDRDFRDRANLYRIQLDALRTEYQRHE